MVPADFGEPRHFVNGLLAELVDALDWIEI
jgi:hypothetical protein